jgi:hypothetical protein
MTWLRKVPGVVVAVLVFAVFLLPLMDWIEGFLGASSLAA